MHVRFTTGILLALATAAHAQMSGAGVAFPMAGIADGQTMRINAVNLGTRGSASASCNVTIRFLDAKGGILKDAAISIGSGKAASADLTRSEASTQSGRIEVHAEFLFGAGGGGAPAGPDVRESMDCNILPSLEIFETSTGKTTLIVTETKPLPHPDARSVASAYPKRYQGLFK